MDDLKSRYTYVKDVHRGGGPGPLPKFCVLQKYLYENKEKSQKKEISYNIILQKLLDFSCLHL